MRLHYTPKVEHACEHCGKVRLYRPCEVRKYCSHRCYAEANKIKHSLTRDCAFCGQSFTRPAWQMGTYCSVACADRAKVTDVAPRFWSKVDKSAGCWLWIPPLGVDGYAKFWRNGRSLHASRVAYELTYGPIPPGLNALHTCDNPACVRPQHLWLGTGKDNSQDMVRKERAGTARLTIDQVKAIKARYAGAHGEQTAMARQYGVSCATIQAIVAGRTWRHVP